ncbi:MAG: hypothetical protein LBH19_02545 [Dysgonamonadaceae bacterium]|jgi:PKD repeat protein|nr:hypothetical protein [Dysgonamonadaceae bacterium]
MKNKIQIILFSLFVLTILSACCEEEVTNPTFGDKDVPVIYIDWAESFAFDVGDVINLSPQISPSDGAVYKWTLNDAVISTDKDLHYALTAPGSYTLHFVVERNGVTNSRTATVLVVKPFDPKTYDKKSIAWITVDGSIGDVPWDDITHLIVSSSVVSADGSVDLTFGGHASLIATLIQTAHNYGVYVLLEYSGVITYLNAVHSYESLTFYHAAVNNRATLIADMIAGIKQLGFDGINVYMDKADNGAFTDPATLKIFYQDLGTALKANTHLIGEVESDYVLSMSVYCGWTNASLLDMVNIPEYDWINVLAFAAEDLTPTAHSAPWYFSDQITQWMDWYGVAPGRIVGVVPAFGLHYFGTISDYTWGNLWQYTEYIPYRTICTTYANAETVNQQPVDNGLYYDGWPAIVEKAQFVKNSNLAGMGLWSVESDSKDPAKSLMKKINTEIGN